MSLEFLRPSGSSFLENFLDNPEKYLKTGCLSKFRRMDYWRESEYLTTVMRKHRIEETPETHFLLDSRAVKVRMASWALRVIYDEGTLDSPSLFPIRKIAVVGPAKIGKTSLVVSLQELFPSLAIGTHYLDVYSRGDEFSVQKKPGWRKGGRKIGSLDTPEAAILFLQRIKELAASDSIIALADTPGGERSYKEWFSSFYFGAVNWGVPHILRTYSKNPK